MRDLDTNERHQIGAELLAEIFRGMQEGTRTLSVAYKERIGELFTDCVGMVDTMEEYAEDATAESLACASYDLGVTLTRLDIDADFYGLIKWLWERIETAKTEEVAR